MGAYALKTANKRFLNHFFSLRLFNRRRRRDGLPVDGMAPKSPEKTEKACIRVFCADALIRTILREPEHV